MDGWVDREMGGWMCGWMGLLKQLPLIHVNLGSSFMKTICLPP